MAVRRQAGLGQDRADLAGHARDHVWVAVTLAEDRVRAILAQPRAVRVQL